MSLSDDDSFGDGKYSTTANNKRKYSALDDDDDFIDEDFKKRKEEHHDEKIVGMKTVLGSQPDEVIANILDFLPPRATINVSSVSGWFRRIWKENIHGIVYNMIIQLKHSFKKGSYSMDSQIEVANFARSAITAAFIKGEKAEKILSRTELFINELRTIKDVSENFTNAISKIDRFDYGQDDKMYYGSSLRKAAGFEISFGKLGVMRFWQWKELEDFGDSKAFAKLSKNLEGLNLTEEEWDAIIEIVSIYFDEVTLEICFDEFQYEEEMGDSIFIESELIPSLPEY